RGGGGRREGSGGAGRARGRAAGSVAAAPQGARGLRRWSAAARAPPRAPRLPRGTYECFPAASRSRGVAELGDEIVDVAAIVGLGELRGAAIVEKSDPLDQQAGGMLLGVQQ